MSRALLLPLLALVLSLHGLGATAAAATKPDLQLEITSPTSGSVIGDPGGMAFISGLDKVVVPFVDRGIPVEYEVVRSIATVSQQQRRRIGVVQTDARLFGGFDMATMSRELSKALATREQKQD